MEEVTREDLIEALDDIVNQHCQIKIDHEKKVITLDSMALSANAYAMRLLVRLGKITIVSEHGRRIIAEARW
jgi:hypothetical protein